MNLSLRLMSENVQFLTLFDVSDGCAHCVGGLEGVQNLRAAVSSSGGGQAIRRAGTTRVERMADPSASEKTYSGTFEACQYHEKFHIPDRDSKC
ncbi:hypothetical protein [Burkholderia multivorans]|uniref:hypothetical protein n=1 Tax=Burkholderia multivorans TaxID=87883 RepID=UPI0021BE2881|nr:hypothetical protein [Burkholderia multivorans]